MTFMNSHPCFTPGKQIIKHCLKFLSRNDRFFASRFTAAEWLAHRQYCRRVYGALHHISPVQFNLLSVTDVWKRSATYVSFVRHFSAPFNVGDCAKLQEEDKVKKIITRNLKHCFPVLHFHRNQICLRVPTPTLTCSGRTLWRSWLRHCVIRRKAAGSIPVGVTGIFHGFSPSGRTMALRSTQPLTEMGYQKYFLEDKGGRCIALTLRISCADCLEVWEPQTPGTSGPVQVCNGTVLPSRLQ